MNKIVRNSIIVIMLLVAGKVFSFLRDIVISHYYGVSDATDAYFVANNIPMIIFTALITSVMAFFIPLYTEKLQNSGQESANRFVANLWNVGLVVTVLLTVGGIVFAPWILHIAAPGFSGEKMEMAVRFARIMVLSFPLTLTILLFSALQNANQRFVLAQTPALISACIVLLGIFFFSHAWGIYALIFSGISAAVLNALIQFAGGKRFFSYTPCFSCVSPELKKLMVLAVPLFVGLTADEINIFVNGSICSLLPAGSISYLNYSQRLLQTINGTLMSGIIIVLYPQFACLAAKHDFESVKFLSCRCVRVVTLLMAPIAFFAILCHREIVKLVFFRGQFGETALQETGVVFACYALSILFIAYRELFNRLFFVFQDAKSPAVTGVCSVIVNIVLSICLAKWLGVKGIALAASVAAIFSSGILYWIFYKKHRQAFPGNPFTWRAICGIFCGLLSMFMVFCLGRWLFGDISPIGLFLLVFLCCFASYTVCVMLFKLDDIVWIRNIILAKISKKNTRKEM